MDPAPRQLADSDRRSSVAPTLTHAAPGHPPRRVLTARLALALLLALAVLLVPGTASAGGGDDGGTTEDGGVTGIAAAGANFAVTVNGRDYDPAAGNETRLRDVVPS